MEWIWRVARTAPKWWRTEMGTATATGREQLWQPQSVSNTKRNVAFP